MIEFRVFRLSKVQHQNSSKFRNHEFLIARMDYLISLVYFVSMVPSVDKKIMFQLDTLFLLSLRIIFLLSTIRAVTAGRPDSILS